MLNAIITTWTCSSLLNYYLIEYYGCALFVLFSGSLLCYVFGVLLLLLCLYSRLLLLPYPTFGDLVVSLCFDGEFLFILLWWYWSCVVVLLVYMLLLFDQGFSMHCYCESKVMDYFVGPRCWIGMVHMLMVQLRWCDHVVTFLWAMFRCFV